ncbi:MAG: toll/interleukin-1 receptor domain-containing protein [Leptolyngbyaceae cyanobacterium SM2_3_12]|nr:toll/interleukin-1 receptor domain-containing protein [Leptolyngbyaceae cyanobacterium SM2_3_12]
MKVFISYSSADIKLAKRVANTLREAGFQVWDDSQILPGENWGASLGKALEESDAMVVLLTPSSVHSASIFHEVGYALGKQEYKGRLIPVIAASSEQLDSREIPWVLNLQQFKTIRLPNLAEDDEGLKQITQALKAVAEV